MTMRANLFGPRFLVVVVLLASACMAAAKPPFLKVLTETYKISPNSELGKAKCLACHQPPAPPRRNPYGLAVQSAMQTAHVRMLTPEILKSIEKMDSDKDGFSNIAEIRAGKLPGDPKSKPDAKAPKPGKKAPKPKKAALLEDQGYTLFGLALISGSVLLWRPRRRSR